MDRTRKTAPRGCQGPSRAFQFTNPNPKPSHPMGMDENMLRKRIAITCYVWEHRPECFPVAAMPRHKKTVMTRSTGVALEVPVLEFLDQLVGQGKAKDRSAAMNSVVRDYAKTIGLVLPSAEITAHQPNLPSMKA